MTNCKLLFGIMATFMMCLITQPTFSEEITELGWDDLMPKDFVLEDPWEKLSDQLNALSDSSPDAQKLMAEMQSARNTAPVVEALNGKKVRIPGYVVPLEGDGETVTEFLLVPYFGACIHVPPPPANQIVYATSVEGVAIEGMWNPVWTTGTLTTTRTNSDLAEAGYKMKLDRIEPYKP